MASPAPRTSRTRSGARREGPRSAGLAIAPRFAITTVHAGPRRPADRLRVRPARRDEGDRRHRREGVGATKARRWCSTIEGSSNTRPRAPRPCASVRTSFASRSSSTAGDREVERRASPTSACRGEQARAARAGAVDPGHPAKKLYALFFAMTALVLIVAGGVAAAVATRGSQPIKTLVDDVRSISNGNLAHRVRAQGGGEVGPSRERHGPHGRRAASEARDAEVELGVREREREVALEVQEALRRPRRSAPPRATTSRANTWAARQIRRRLPRGRPGGRRRRRVLRLRRQRHGRARRARGCHGAGLPALGLRGPRMSSPRPSRRSTTLAGETAAGCTSPFRRAARPHDPRAGGGLRATSCPWCTGRRRRRPSARSSPTGSRSASTRDGLRPRPLHPPGAHGSSGTGSFGRDIAVRVVDHEGAEIGEKRLYQLRAERPGRRRGGWTTIRRRARGLRGRGALPRRRVGRRARSRGLTPEPRSSRADWLERASHIGRRCWRSRLSCVYWAPRRAAMMAGGRSTHEQVPARAPWRRGLRPEPARAAGGRLPAARPLCRRRWRATRPSRSTGRCGTSSPTECRASSTSASAWASGSASPSQAGGRSASSWSGSTPPTSPPLASSRCARSSTTSPPWARRCSSSRAGSRLLRLLLGRGPRGRRFRPRPQREGGRKTVAVYAVAPGVDESRLGEREGKALAKQHSGPAHSPRGGRPDPPCRPAQEARRHRRGCAPS